MSILFRLGGGKELLVGFTGIGGYDMIATEKVDDDLWFFVQPEFVDDGLDDAFFQNGIRWLRLWFLQLLRLGRRGFLLFCRGFSGYRGARVKKQVKRTPVASSR